MYVKQEDINLFWGLFRYVEWGPEDMVELRKIAHDGTWQQSVAFQPALQDIPAVLAKSCDRAAGVIGYFMCPGKLNGPRATDESVTALVCLSVDIDRGDTDASLAKLRWLFGEPTLVVHSGGYTETGHKKLHVHYRLSEPETDTKAVAEVREAMALEVGGDISFKRIPQVIRIPGSVYDKNKDGVIVSVLNSSPDSDVNFIDVQEKMESRIQAMRQHRAEMDFSGNPEAKAERFQQVASEKIHAGGTEDDNRFNRFSEYAGRWIGHARSGDCTTDEAYSYVLNWNRENMVPPWDDQRVQKEFRALLNLDMSKHGDEWSKQKESVPVPASQAESGESWSWLSFDARNIFVGKPDPIPFLADQFIIEGSTHGLVADSGIGKTYVALDMALRLAAGPQRGNKILGFPVLRKCVSILITVEDSRDDLHRRIYNIDPGGNLLKNTEGRCLVLPVADEIYGGLTLVEKDKYGNHTVSRAWKLLTEKLQEVRDAFPDFPFVVFLDTYSATHHGDENSSAGTNEWFRAAGIVRNQFNAAVFVTHHIRKTNSEPINTPDEMRQYVRGSNAFVASCRVVYGIWNMPGSKKLAEEAAGDSEEKTAMQFLNLSPIKSNVGLDWSEKTNGQHAEPIITLRRTGSGQPIYDAEMHEKRITYKDRKREQEQKTAEVVASQTEAGVLLAVREFALRGKPLNMTDMTKDKMVCLPHPASEMSRSKIEEVVGKMISDGRIVRRNIKANRTRMDIHDVPGGPFALGEETERTPESVVVEWAGFSYDAQSQSYQPIEEKERGAA